MALGDWDILLFIFRFSSRSLTCYMALCRGCRGEVSFRLSTDEECMRAATGTRALKRCVDFSVDNQVRLSCYLMFT